MATADIPTVRCFPLGLRAEAPHGPSTVEIEHDGFRFVLRFKQGDTWGDGPLQKLEIEPLETSTSLEPRALRQFAKKTELYVGLARAAMKTMQTSGATPEERRSRLLGAVQTLRSVGGPGRGLPDEHYRAIGDHYKALVDEGEPHPVKAISESHNVSISAASRWVTEARHRGYLI